MKNKNMLKLALLPLLAITIAGCGDNTSNSDKPVGPSTPSGEGPTEEVSSSYEDKMSWSQISEELKLIPQEVLDAQVEIDFLVYIEGQRDRLPDIGNYCWDKTDPQYSAYRYHPEDVTSLEMARYFGAAQAFKKLAPGVKINLQFCSIADYGSMIQDYRDAKGHLPQLMWGTDHVVEMLGVGYNHDLSIYADSEYYQQYNEYFMSRFNFGGFQAGIPVSGEPWGVFVNLNSLEDFDIVTDVIDNDLGEPTDEYKEWVDNFTWDNFVDAVKKSTNETHAGLSKVVEYFTSYSVQSINEQFIRDGSVDISSPEVQETIKKLLEYENELSQYCVYNYSAESFGGSLIKKDYFTNAAGWAGTQNFVADEYCTFYAEAPWALPTISQYVTSHNEKAAADTTGTMKPLDTKVDFLPYPKVDEDSQAYTGIAVEGLTVGNLCPVGEDGRKHCATATSELEMDVAAYFAMFMGLDPRAIQSRYEVQYVFDGRTYIGDLALPLTKRGKKFSWQEDDEFAHIEDPAENFDDNWQYQMSLWFDVYDLYVTNDQPADVENFTNITYGLVQMLDSIYMLDGYGDDYVTCLNYWNEPVNIPDGDGVKDIFDQWQTRFTMYRNEETNDGVLGTASYVSNVLAQLAAIEEDINSTSETAWEFLQECVDSYYYDENFESLYNVLDRTSRNDYEGSYLN